MKTYEQTTAAVLARRDEYIKKAAKRRRIAVSAGIPAVCVIAIVIVFAGMRRTGAFRPGVDAGPSAPDLVTDAGTPPTEPAGNALTEIAPENASRVKSTEAEIMTEEPNQVGTPYTLPEDTTGGYIALEPTFVQSDVTVSRAAEPGTVTGTTTHSEGYGGSIGTGYFCIPMIPFDRTIVVTGERITDEEAADYLATHESIRYALLASGVDAEELTFSERGYSHVCYSGIEGEKLEVRVNFRDYLAYSGGKLVAIVTLTERRHYGHSRLRRAVVRRLRRLP